MGFFGKLVGIGLTAAAAVTAAKVAKKYMENKNDDTFDAEGVELDDIEAEEAEAAGEEPEDGEPPLTSFEEKVYDAAEAARDTLDDVAQAAGDVLDEVCKHLPPAGEQEPDDGRVTVAVIRGRTLSSSTPWRTTRETNSGNSTLDSVVWKNFSTRSEPAPFTLMSNRLSWRWNASSPSRGVPR